MSGMRANRTSRTRSLDQTSCRLANNGSAAYAGACCAADGATAGWTTSIRQASMKIDYVAWAVMFIALAGLFWNVNTDFSRVHERMDRLQAETSRRFDTMQAENQRQHDAMEAENQRRHDGMEEVLRIFEGLYYAP